jgi:putative hemolysin
MTIWTELFVIVVLAIANGLFAAAEIAVILVRKSRLKELMAEGNPIRRQPERFLSTVQIGITRIGATAAAFGGATLAARASVLLERAGLGPRTAADVALAGVILFVSYASLVLGELVPKSLALRGAERYSMLVSRPLLALATIARPVVWFLTASSNAILRLFRDRTTFTEACLSPSELQTLVEEAAQEGVIDPSAGEIASRALDFGRLRAAQVMVPRTEIRPLDATLTADAVRRRYVDEIADRQPIYEGNQDNITGYVTLREVLLAGPDRTLKELARTSVVVPESVPAVDVLREMQREQVQLAMVVDETGSVVGIVTLEALVEELVGDILAEHEQPTAGLRREPDGSVVVLGTTPIHEVNRMLHVDLPESSAWTTLAGLIIAELGTIPEPGAKRASATSISRWSTPRVVGSRPSACASCPSRRAPGRPDSRSASERERRALPSVDARARRRLRRRPAGFCC